MIMGEDRDKGLRAFLAERGRLGNDREMEKRMAKRIGQIVWIIKRGAR